MNQTAEKIKEHFEPEKKVNKGRKALLIGGSVFLVIFFIGLIATLYELRYKNVIIPNVSIAGINLGNMTVEQAERTLYAKYDQMIQEDLMISFGGENESIPLSSITESEFATELVFFYAQEAAQEAFQKGHAGTISIRFMDHLNSIVGGIELNTNDFLQMDRIALKEDILNTFGEKEEPGRPTKFNINAETEEIQVELGSRGKEIDIETLLANIEKDLEDLTLGSHEIKLKVEEPPVSVQDAETLIDDVKALQEKAPLVLTHESELGRSFTWEIDENELIEAILPAKRDDELLLSISLGELESVVEDINNRVNVEPTNARFQITNGQVSEFAGSRSGVKFDQDATEKKIEVIFNNNGVEEFEVEVATQVTEPQIKTGEINDLGITEVLGTGTSSWRGSPANRIHNIRNATDKLNGLLIPPGEQASTTGNVGPITFDNGYRAEAIIAGDEIKPEVGGGLCQIGTTVFRAAMNAGLQIDERRNHSLVVSYYNDPSNGNPGTDATLYDPILDLKFTNTTDHHILLVTEFDEANSELVYTFWGTSDGRKGYYTPPQVLGWRGGGETRYTETDSLAPGEMKCQSAFPGATTSFDYIIEYPDGTSETQNFTSNYRALPRICLVGAEPGAGEEGQEEELSEAAQILLQEQEALLQ